MSADFCLTWVWDEAFEAWTVYDEDGAAQADLFPHEMDEYPPLVEARAEAARLWTRIDDLCTEVNAVYAAVDDLLGEVEDGDWHPSSIAEALRGILAIVDGPEATR